LERLQKLAKKSGKYNKESDKKLSEIITKAKKGNLQKEEKINPTVPPFLADEL
jgi:hypothetical protein